MLNEMLNSGLNMFTHQLLEVMGTALMERSNGYYLISQDQASCDLPDLQSLPWSGVVPAHALKVTDSDIHAVLCHHRGMLLDSDCAQLP